MKQQIISQVEAKPGIHFRKLQRELDCSKSTVNYHISNIEDLEEEKIRGYRRFYPSKIKEEDRNILAALNHSPRGEILYELQQKHQKLTTISENVDKSPATVSQHLDILKNAGLVDKRNKYRLKNRTTEKVKQYSSRILEGRVDNFIDMWE
ncbi:MAG: putative transcriptional regulator [Candidatus Nanohaloarchaea archaeon]|jgi:predicted transcriptional regulator